MRYTKKGGWSALLVSTIMVLYCYTAKAADPLPAAPPPPPPYTVYVLEIVGPCKPPDPPCQAFRYFATDADREHFLAQALKTCFAKRPNTTYSILPGPDGIEVYVNCP